MSRIFLDLPIENATPDPGSNPGLYVSVAGSVHPYSAMWCDDDVNYEMMWSFRLWRYDGNGCNVNYYWNSETDTSGHTRWRAQMQCQTPETDNVGWKQRSWDTLQQVQVSHLGTTAERLHQSTRVFTHGQMDAPAEDDICHMIVQLRSSSSLTGLVGLVAATIDWGAA